MYLNETFLIGEVVRRPELRTGEGGTLSCTTALCLRENRDGQQFKTYVPLEAVGTAAHILRILPTGALVVKGQLRYRSWTNTRGEKHGQLEVLTWQVQPVPTPPGAASQAVHPTSSHQREACSTGTAGREAGDTANSAHRE